MKKFAFIGAGSYGFTRTLVRDLLTFPAFEDCELALMDINPLRLEKITACAKDPKITIFDLAVHREGEEYIVTFRAWFVGRKQDKRRSALYAALTRSEGVICVNNTSAEAKV